MNIADIFLILLSPDLTLADQLSQLTQTQSLSTNLSSVNNFTQKIIVAIVSAILGFIANLILERYKKKNEPKFQISYQKSVKKGLIDIEKDIKDKISILYDHKPTQNLYYCLFDIKNTGNRIIKDQDIRFEFSNGSKIIDMFYDPPIPEKEMNLDTINEPNLSNLEIKHKIGYFEPGKKFGFRFIVVANDSINEINMKHFTKNNSPEHVIFSELSTLRTASSIDIIQDFILWILILNVVPLSIANIMPLIFIKPIILGISKLLTLVIVLQKLEAFTKAILNLISNSQSKKEITIKNLHIEGSSQIAILQDDAYANAINGIDGVTTN